MPVIGMILTAKMLIMFFSTTAAMQVEETKPFNPRLKCISLRLPLTVRCLISKVPSHVGFTLTSILERNKCSWVQTDVLRVERRFGRLCPCRL